MCTRCGGKPHSSRPCPALSKKATSVKKWDTSQNCEEANLNQIQVSTINRVTFAKKKMFLQSKHLQHRRWECFVLKKQIFSMSVTWEYISINNCKVKMQADTGADSKVISSKIWTELGKPQLDGTIRHLEAYDGHQLTLLGSLTCDVEWNGSKLTQKQLAVVQSDEEFGLLGRDLLPKHGVNNITAEQLLNSKPVDSVRLLGYSLSKEGIAPDPKHVEKLKNAKAPTNNKQLESFVGLAIFYGRMIPDFATKMLP